MRTVPSPRFYEILPPENRPAERVGFRTADHESEWFAAEETPGGGRRPGARILALLFVGIAAVIVGWQSTYGRDTREAIASLSPSLRWVAPEQTAHDRIEQITRSVDNMASDIAASREELTRSIDHLAAGQDQIAREIVRLQALSQYAAGQPAPEGLHKTGRRSR